VTQPAKPAEKPASPVRQAPAPKAPPWWATLRADAPFLPKLLIGLGALGALLLVWWFQSRNSIKLPSPGSVFGSYTQHYGNTSKVTKTIPALVDRDLGDNISVTLLRVFWGVSLAAIVGVTLGVLSSAYRMVAAAVSPIVIFLRSVPMGAMLPLVLVFATGERGKIIFIFLAIVAFVFSDTFKAVSTVPQRYVETAETLGASRFQIIYKVLFPLALPDILTSLRFQFGLALGYIMLVEVIDQDRGLGVMLSNGQKFGMIEQNFLLLFIIAFLAFMIDFVLRELQRGLFRYRQDL
jgi:ABC-type nitrate/sulfonate/bicarbonate transport system permease component